MDRCTAYAKLPPSALQASLGWLATEHHNYAVLLRW